MTLELAKAKQILIEAGGDIDSSSDLQSYIQGSELTLTADGSKIQIKQPNGKTVNLPAATATDAGLITAAGYEKLSDLPTATQLSTSLNGKVDKESGKGLISTSLATALENVGDLEVALDSKVDKETGKGLIDAAPVDGRIYGRYNGGWTQVTGGGGSGDVEEAPIDGKQYARKNAAWEEVVASGGGGGVEEAPIDGKQYVRKDGLWEATSPFKLEVPANFASFLTTQGGHTLDSAMHSVCLEILEKTPAYLFSYDSNGVPNFFRVRYFTVYSDDSAALGVDRYLMAIVEGQGDGQRFISLLNYSRLEGSFEEGEISTSGEGGGFKSYRSIQDITSEVLSGVRYYDPNGSEVGSELALSGGIYYKFDTSAIGAYSIQIEQSNIDTVMSFAGEGGVGASEFSFYAPFQSHSSSFLKATWAGCTLIGATLLTSER